MIVDLEQKLAGNLPWELVIQVGGVNLVMRRPSLAEIGQLQVIDALSKSQQNKLLSDLCGGADVTAIAEDYERVQGLLAAYLGYFRERNLKNSRSIAASVRAAMATPAPTNGTANSTFGN